MRKSEKKKEQEKKREVNKILPKWSKNLTM